VQSIAISESVCLFVCLRVCLSTRITTNFQYMLPVAIDRSSSDGNAVSYNVLPVLQMMSCFLIVNQIGQKSKTTRMFRPVLRVAAPVGHQTTLFGRVRQAAAPEAKSVVSDCILFKI